MKIDFKNRYVSFSNWLKSSRQLAFEKKSELAQILASIIVIIVGTTSLQFLPFLVSFFHISDMQFGKTVVYSLPVWIVLAFYLIWRS